MLKSPRWLWTISNIVAISLLIATVVVIYDATSKYLPDAGQITTNDQVAKFIQTHWSVKHDGEKKSVYVPTGVFVKSLYFISSNNVHISGYVWQKYDASTMHIEDKNIIFPEAIEAKVEESYRRFEHGQLVIGWSFEGQFIQKFNYFKFPLDNKVVWLRMWHADFDKNVILTPDLDSYDSTAIYDKFGIDPEIVLGGYSILETFFSYKKSNYDTDFGIENYVGKKDFPELYFNIPLKRNVLNSLVIYFLPLLTIVALIFFGVLLITVDPVRLPILGYSLLNLLSLASFLLFVVVLSHIQLRTQVTSETIMYIEYVYIIIYCMITYAIIIAFMVDRGNRFSEPFLTYQDGLWLKLTLMPMLAVLVFIATIFSF